jgi:hypothetical protein
LFGKVDKVKWPAEFGRLFLLTHPDDAGNRNAEFNNLAAVTRNTTKPVEPSGVIA